MIKRTETAFLKEVMNFICHYIPMIANRVKTPYHENLDFSNAVDIDVPF